MASVQGFPLAFGGWFKDPSLGEKRMASFVSHTLLDIQENTRIIAVCGPTDEMDFTSPENDGRFFSDFFFCVPYFTVRNRKQSSVANVREPQRPS